MVEISHAKSKVSLLSPTKCLTSKFKVLMEKKFNNQGIHDHT